MNSRRSFLKSMLLSAVAPTILAAVAGDRFKWKRSKELWVPNEFSAREYYGEWKFTYQSRDGIWVSEQPNRPITPVGIPSPMYKSETHIRVFMEDRDKSYIFHRREPLFSSVLATLPGIDADEQFHLDCCRDSLCEIP